MFLQIYIISCIKQNRMVYFNPLKLKLILIILKNSVCTSKKTHHVLMFLWVMMPCRLIGRYTASQPRRTTMSSSLPWKPQISHVSITIINWLMLFKEIIPLHSKNHMKPIGTKCSYWLLKQVVHIVTTGLRLRDLK
jgi:hypothetical protein